VNSPDRKKPLQTGAACNLLIYLVRRGGLEPPRCYPLAPQASASANSAISAIRGKLLLVFYGRRGGFLNYGRALVLEDTARPGHGFHRHDRKRQRGDHEQSGRDGGALGEHR